MVQPPGLKSPTLEVQAQPLTVAQDARSHQHGCERERKRQREKKKREQREKRRKKIKDKKEKKKE